MKRKKRKKAKITKDPIYFPVKNKAKSFLERNGYEIDVSDNFVDKFKEEVENLVKDRKFKRKILDKDDAKHIIKTIISSIVTCLDFGIALEFLNMVFFYTTVKEKDDCRKGFFKKAYIVPYPYVRNKASYKLNQDNKEYLDYIQGIKNEKLETRIKKGKKIFNFDKKRSKKNHVSSKNKG